MNSHNPTREGGPPFVEYDFGMKPGGFDSKILSLAKGVGDQGNHPASKDENDSPIR